MILVVHNVSSCTRTITTATTWTVDGCFGRKMASESMPSDDQFLVYQYSKEFP